MEDLIIREIHMIGKIIEAILCRIGALGRSGTYESAFEVVRMELSGRLDLDIDTLIDDDNFIDVLVCRYKFSDYDFDKFAELLYRLVETADQDALRMKLIRRIKEIYEYLERNSRYISFSGYGIIKELERYH